MVDVRVAGQQNTTYMKNEQLDSKIVKKKENKNWKEM